MEVKKLKVERSASVLRHGSKFVLGYRFLGVCSVYRLHVLIDKMRDRSANIRTCTVVVRCSCGIQVARRRLSF